MCGVIKNPLKKTIGYEITSENGFSKENLALELSKAYSEMFMNKEKHGICCDELADLELTSILVFKVGQEIYLETKVDSKK